MLSRFSGFQEMLTHGRSRKLSAYSIGLNLQADRFSRTAAKKAHPDVGGSEEKMAAINEAYEVLSNDGTLNGDFRMY